MKYWSMLMAVLVFACGVAGAQTATENPLTSARVFDSDQMKARMAPNGTESRMVFNGTLATGESVGAHESTQPAGTVPPQLHKNQHSELIVIQQGTVEFDHDGKAERAGAEASFTFLSVQRTSVKNIGDGPAKYVVIQIGGDTKK